jgi:uncharacterized membrane protein
LILLLIAIFPANIHIALNGWPGMDIPGWVLWARLPFQLLFLGWVLFSCPGLAVWIRTFFPQPPARNFPKP